MNEMVTWPLTNEFDGNLQKKKIIGIFIKMLGMGKKEQKTANKTRSNVW